MLGSSMVPHFHIIPVLWRAISLSSRPSAFRARASSLMDAVVQSTAFHHELEHHVLLHTSTAATSELWGRHSALLIDPRIIVLHLEGEAGDLRPGKCAASLTRPSIRPPCLTLARWLGRSLTLNALRSHPKVSFRWTYGRRALLCGAGGSCARDAATPPEVEPSPAANPRAAEMETLSTESVAAACDADDGAPQPLAKRRRDACTAGS